MPALKEIEQSLNHLFQIEKYGKDSGLAAIGIGGLLIIINVVLIGIELYLMIGIATGSIRLM